MRFRSPRAGSFVVISSAIAAIVFTSACASEIRDADSPGAPGAGTDGKGTGGAGMNPGNGSQSGSGAGPSAECAPNAPSPIPGRVRRLTATEYHNTVAALTGETSEIVKFPRDPVSNGYSNKAEQLRVTSVLAQNLWVDTPELAASTAERLMESAPCETRGARAESCATEMLSAFASSAYRRPATDEEIQDLLTVFRTGYEGGTFREGLTLALRVVFQSAGFLYHTELGDGNANAGRFKLTPYEVAAQLSYLVTGGPPDAELLAAAESGAIESADERRRHAERLMSRPEAKRAIGQFGAEWLNVARVVDTNRDNKLYPDWPTLRTLALNETRDFFATAVIDESATLADLFTAKWTIADDRLVRFYGATKADGRVMLPEERMGVLTQAAFLGVYSQAVDGSPIQRGHFVRSRLLCQELPPPPPELVITLPPPDPERTTRERFAAHSADATCAGCHRLMDPLGYAFSHFDAIGQYRSTENGKPIDASGELVQSDVDGSFENAIELASLLAESEMARACFVRHWLEFSTARTVDDAVQCAAQGAAANFVDGGNVRDLVLSYVASDLFTDRAPMAK